LNWFVFIAGVLYLGAAVVYITQGKMLLAGAFLAYAAANFFLMRVQ